MLGLFKSGQGLFCGVLRQLLGVFIYCSVYVLGVFEIWRRDVSEVVSKV